MAVRYITAAELSVNNFFPFCDLIFNYEQSTGNVINSSFGNMEIISDLVDIMEGSSCYSKHVIMDCFYFIFQDILSLSLTVCILFGTVFILLMLYVGLKNHHMLVKPKLK